MSDKTKGSFSSLNPDATIFEELRLQQPWWWTMFCNDKKVYIDIRKDNYINIYYFGGSVAKIAWEKGSFVAETNAKYLPPSIINSAANNRDENYFKLKLEDFDENLFEDIKAKINSEYLRLTGNNEKPAEKWIQGRLIISSANYIDSEFQFNKDVEIGKLRIDLVELSDGVLSFVELKGISDSRLRNDPKRNTKIPEIIDQMKKYKLFINKYESEICDYYRKLINIKKSLGLLENTSNQFIVNRNPKLVIVNTYNKITTPRNSRIHDIKAILNSNNIDFEINENHYSPR